MEGMTQETTIITCDELETLTAKARDEHGVGFMPTAVAAAAGGMVGATVTWLVLRRRRITTTGEALLA